MSGNKWLNIEVAQNKKEVRDPLINFENNVPMKTHAKIHAKWTNPCTITFKWKHLNILAKHSIKFLSNCIYVYIYINVTFTHTFSMHLEISPFVPMGNVYTWNTSKKRCVIYMQWSCLAKGFFIRKLPQIVKIGKYLNVFSCTVAFFNH